MSATKYVIVAFDGTFWTGSSWAKEYPDALTFSKLSGAVAEAERWETSKVRRDVVSNYGLETERVERALVARG